MYSKFIAYNITPWFAWSKGAFDYREIRNRDVKMINRYLRKEDPRYYHYRFDEAMEKAILPANKKSGAANSIILMFKKHGEFSRYKESIEFEKFIGFGDLMPASNDEYIMIACRFIREQYSKMGYGTALGALLIEKCIKDMPHIFGCCFQVHERNVASHNSHRKLMKIYRCLVSGPHEILDSKTGRTWRMFNYIYMTGMNKTLDISKIQPPKPLEDKCWCI